MLLPVDPSLSLKDVDPATLRERGVDHASKTPPVKLAEFSLAKPADRDVVTYLEQTGKNRLKRLESLRIERMSESPFAFFRGTAGIMAADMAAGPNSALLAQICGDAHASNFGLFGTTDGILMDVNDFDETCVGPWEWDLKRLLVSLVLASREVGHTTKHARKAVKKASKSYRKTVKKLAEMPYKTSFEEMANQSQLTGHSHLSEDFAHAIKKARRNDSDRVVKKYVQIDTHKAGIESQRFTDDPPVLFHVSEDEADGVAASLAGYLDTLPPAQRELMRRYRILDVAFRVVGTGSVGMRSYIILLEGNREEEPGKSHDYIVLQVKQEAQSALAPWLPKGGMETQVNQGRRVVDGARLVQARTDPLMGWTRKTQYPFIVRQFRDQKGSLDPTALTYKEMYEFGEICAALLARAHSRSINPLTLRGYLAKAKVVDDAFGTYAVKYAEQVEKDYATFLNQLKEGELKK